MTATSTERGPALTPAERDRLQVKMLLEWLENRQPAWRPRWPAKENQRDEA